jgi:hypothetical protein
MKLDPVIEKALKADRFMVVKDKSIFDNWELFKAAEAEFDTYFTSTQAQIQHQDFNEQKFTNNIWLLQEIFWLLCNVHANMPKGGMAFFYLDYIHFAYDRLLYLKSMYNVATYGLNHPSYRRGYPSGTEPTPAKHIIVEVYGTHDFNDFGV